MDSDKEIISRYLEDIRKLSQDCEKSEDLVKELFKNKYKELAENAKIHAFIPVIVSQAIRSELGKTKIKEIKEDLKTIEKSSNLKKKKRKKIKEIFKK